MITQLERYKSALVEHMVDLFLTNVILLEVEVCDGVAAQVRYICTSCQASGPPGDIAHTSDCKYVETLGEGRAALSYVRSEIEKIEQERRQEGKRRHDRP